MIVFNFKTYVLVHTHGESSVSLNMSADGNIFATHSGEVWQLGSVWDVTMKRCVILAR